MFLFLGIFDAFLFVFWLFIFCFFYIIFFFIAVLSHLCILSEARKCGHLKKKENRVEKRRRAFGVSSHPFHFHIPKLLSLQLFLPLAQNLFSFFFLLLLLFLCLTVRFVFLISRNPKTMLCKKSSFSWFC